MKTGYVKLFKDGTGKGCGYGFIKPDSGGDEIFFHFSNAYPGVKKDDRVTFDTEDGKKGLYAVNINEE